MKTKVNCMRTLTEKRFALMIAFAVCVVAVVVAIPLVTANAAPITGTLDKDGATYTYSVANGEATITHIAKASSNTNATYEALVPDSISVDSNTYSVTSIGANAMGTSVTIGQASSITLVTNDELVGITIPARLISIGNQAFCGCTALKQITFSSDSEDINHLSSIGEWAFYKTSISDLQLPDSLAEIKLYAFRDMSQLSTLKLPATQTTWDDDAFYNTYISNNVVIPDGCVSIPIIRTGATSVCVPASAEGTVQIEAHATSVSLPAEAKFTTLKLSFDKLNSLVIPESVTSIKLSGECADIKLPSNLKTIIGLHITNIKELVIPASVEYIQSTAFANNSSLEKLTFEDGSQASSVGSYACAGCQNLKEVKLGNGLKTLGAFMFDGCSSLESVTVPASVERINLPAFIDCSSLESIDFERSSKCTSINCLAKDCPLLKRVELPDGLTTIDRSSVHDSYSLIKNCPELVSVCIYSPDLDLKDSDFSACGDYQIYGWGTAGNVLDFAESSGHTFIPYAELDASGYNKASNTAVTPKTGNTASAVCSFNTPTSFDYSRALASGQDYSLSTTTENNITYLVLTGNGITCFGTAKVSALRDIGAATMSAIETQIYSGTPCAPKLTITLNGSQLVEGVDYSLSYADNGKTGMATVTATGTGSFDGTLSGTFAIKSAIEQTGTDRIQNAQTAVQDSGVASTGRVIMAWEYDYSGIAAAGALSARTGYPLVAVSKNGLTTAQKQQLSSWGAGTVLLIGGTDSCGLQTGADVAKAGATCVTVGNGSAEAVARSIAAQTKSWGSVAVLTNPDDAALCLQASAFASAANAPLLLTGQDGTIDSATATILSGYENIVIIGYATQVDYSVDASLSNEMRIYGDNEESTSLTLADYGIKQGAFSSGTKVFITTTDDATSFMTWAVNAGSSHAPVIIVDADDSAKVTAFVKAHSNVLTGYVLMERESGSLQTIESDLQGALR